MALYEDELPDILHNLRRTSYSLRTLGYLGFISTMVNVGSALLLLVTTSGVTYYDNLGAAMWLLLMTGISLIILAVYDSRQRSGDVMFAELSDELQWNLSQPTKTDDKSETKGRPLINYRIVLREYTGITGLPLIRNKNGPLIYAVLNLASLFIYILRITFLS